MAIFAGRATKRAELTRGEVIDNLARQIALLRNEVSTMSHTALGHRDNALSDVQRNAVALLHELGRGGRYFAQRFSREASLAGKAVQSNPVPVLVTLGTLALLSRLLISRD